MLTLPESCPKIALRCETAMIGMKCIESGWRRQVYEESRDKGWPGLGQEVREIYQEVGLSDMTHRISRQSN